MPRPSNDANYYRSQETLRATYLIVTSGNAVPYGLQVSGLMDVGPVVP